MYIDDLKYETTQILTKRTRKTKTTTTTITSTLALKMSEKKKKTTKKQTTDKASHNKKIKSKSSTPKPSKNNFKLLQQLKKRLNETQKKSLDNNVDDLSINLSGVDTILIDENEEFDEFI